MDWNVLKGRKDGRMSRANETINLPPPTFNEDLVALSGGRALGFSHCSSFESRLRNFRVFTLFFIRIPTSEF
ncbi:unnamed protein product [Malus baccata var. baccata]